MEWIGDHCDNDMHRREVDIPGGTKFIENHSGIIAARLDELALTPLPVSTVNIVENEITYLAFPLPSRA